jgi:chitodextrinase
VDAFDAAGNHSTASNPVSITTPDVPTSLTLNPVADTYVNAGSPTSNYGSSTSLRADGSPDLHSYIRFNIQGTGGAPVSRARLFIYASSGSLSNLAIQAVADNSWGELTTNYNNAPALGSVLTSVPSVTGGTWLEFNVTPYVTGDGLLSFGVSTSGATSISFASRESGANTPQLIVDFLTGAPDTQAPTVPNGLTANASSSTQVNLNWNASSDNIAVTGYTVYRDGVSLATVSSSTLAYSDTTVSSATTYQYSVDAFDAAGNHSAPNSQASVTTSDTPPTVPTGLSANVVSPTQVDLGWNASTDNVGVAGYTVYRDGTSIATLSGSTLTYSDTSVLPGITYSYTVDAFDGGGNHSAASDPAVVTTPDTLPPSVPAGLTANASNPTQVDLGWSASTDNVAVSGYTIYRDGTSIATVSGSTLAYSDTTASPVTTYQYSVDAFDGAGNHSAASDPVTATTPDVASSLTFVPVADSYVNAGSPSSNYGSSTSLRADASPDVHSYLRFNVQGLGGKTIGQARLLIYVNSNANQGIAVQSVTDNSWVESTMNYNNAPALGSTLASSGAVNAGNWVELDVTSYITGEGTYSFGIITPSSTALSMASREAGANAPQLILNLN